MSSIKLEAGKKYRSRGGFVYGPITKNDDPLTRSYPYTDGQLTWLEDGRWCRGGTDVDDLVEEVADPLDVMEAAAQAEQQADAAGAGSKHDAGKPPLSLIPRAALLAEAEVLAFGAQKYDAHNWRKGMRWSRLGDAAMRHLLAWLDGEDNDPETGLPHLAHLRCCSGFLLEYAQSGAGTDDRYKADA